MIEKHSTFHVLTFPKNTHVKRNLVEFEQFTLLFILDNHSFKPTMSDEDDVRYSNKKNVIHYGSLAEGEKKRLANAAAGNSSAPGTNKNVNISNEYMNLEDRKVNSERQQMLEEFERKRKSRQITVSVDDVEVRAHLRHLNVPICLFGEGPADRRERLRQVLAERGQDAIRKDKGDEKEDKDKDKDNSSTWYHEGPESLRQARLYIADYSVPRARERLINARLERELPETTRSNVRQELYKQLRNLEISCSQVGDSRPISSCQFSPNGQLIVTSSWSGLCKLWSMPNLDHQQTLRGHNGVVCSIEFHPKATLSQQSNELNLASCSVDGTINLWTLIDSDPIGTIGGHEPHRVSSVKFHPSGRFLATCCYDKSWRLFDLTTSEELLFQEGHSKAVKDVTFQCDGSLAATGGLDSFGRVWDLRTGRCIMFLEGHLKSILSIDFSPNGYQLVTGSEDHAVKVWDIRQRRCMYTIPAHSNIVSKVLFEKENGHYIVSSSYDSSVKLWTSPNYTPICTLSGHDNKVMSVDMSRDNKNFISASFDRTFKLWTADFCN